MAWTAVADLLGLTQPAVTNTVTRAETKAVDGKLNFDEPQNAKVMCVLNKPWLFSRSQIRPQEESRSVILRANKVEVLRPRVPSSKMMTRFLCLPRSEFKQKCTEHGAWSRTSRCKAAGCIRPGSGSEVRSFRFWDMEAFSQYFGRNHAGRESGKIAGGSIPGISAHGSKDC
jgi:hypothetical protein